MRRSGRAAQRQLGGVSGFGAASAAAFALLESRTVLARGDPRARRSSRHLGVQQFNSVLRRAAWSPCGPRGVGAPPEAADGVPRWPALLPADDKSGVIALPRRANDPLERPSEPQSALSLLLRAYRNGYDAGRAEWRRPLGSAGRGQRHGVPPGPPACPPPAARPPTSPRTPPSAVPLSLRFHRADVIEETSGHWPPGPSLHPESPRGPPRAS